MNGLPWWLDHEQVGEWKGRNALACLLCRTGKILLLLEKGPGYTPYGRVGPLGS